MSPLSKPGDHSSAAQPFIWAVQALAHPASIQLSLFPDLAAVPDELALDHEEAQRAFLESNEARRLTAVQRETVSRLDNYLGEMSDRDDIGLWTVDALNSAPEWILVRKLAIDVLRVFEWPFRIPPAGRAIYVMAT